MWEALWSGALAGYGIAVPVGAVAVLIVGTAVRGGFRLGAAAGAGAATADLLYAGIAAFAGAAAAKWLEGWERVIAVASAVVLVGIVIAGLRRDRSQGAAAPFEGSAGSTYAAFLLLTVVNPLTVVYFSSLVIGLGLGSGSSAAAGVVFAVAAFAASLSWQLLLAGVGAYGRHRLGERFGRAVSALGNLIVLGFAALILIRAF
jgi:threonine/homoserine/homoserine lactone efflux protein